MSLDEAADVGLPCPGPTAAASAAAAAAASGAAGLAVNLTSLVGCNTTLVISTAGPSPSSSTFSAPINFTWQDLTVVAVSCIVIALIVIGNTLVIVAVMTTRRLRTITNCFVMSLAVADWLVGVFVLPPAVAYQLMGTWELGWVLCDLWVSLDVLLCTASILSLCAISVDRYLAVTQPLNYSRRRRSKRLALAMILAVWVVAAAITCPPILGW
ncbi:probable G-protein coupled receptor No18 [Frankliniella occidentalis]|uniref:Probable G-protein coupled receptor No18 n=1 Tax=Frankliniella occidentalis TaxID=133901 RepID=A0A9C6X2B6_FRAOC|nr:probable G-protein coupled receptor No18 [Frankliniella occidentalis]XP_052127831.1 probable G-protein coupled receptor No18 [Frankliniella occidentalis]